MAGEKKNKYSEIVFQDHTINMLINIQLCTATLMNELSVCCTFQELKMLSILTFLQLSMHISIEWEGTTLFISICLHLVEL